MTSVFDEEKKIERVLERIAQPHLAERVRQCPPSGALRKQVLGIDLEDFRLQQEILRRGDESIPAADEFEPIEPVDPTKSPIGDKRFAEARKTGEALLASGQVAVVTVAGGQGTRFGYSGPKGCYPITPLRKKSFFQWHAERILAASRRCGRSLPWFIMTSSHTDEATRCAFRQNGWFGLPPDDVFFFVQGSLPILDRRGRLIFDPDGNLLTGPDGHGGLLEAIKNSSALEQIARRGIKFLSYFQVDNVLARPVDPLFIGLHAMQDAEVSCKVVQKRDAEEGLGLVARRNGTPCVVEYMEAMRNRMAYLTDREGRLLYRTGSIAIHVFSVSLLERLFAENIRLPYHLSLKSMEHISADGRRVGKGARDEKVVKFERFIFDVIPFARGVMVMETRRGEEFAPVKRAEGDDSPDTAQAAMRNLFVSWLKACRIDVPEGAMVEISPLYAEGPEELAARLRREPRLAWPLVLE